MSDKKEFQPDKPGFLVYVILFLVIGVLLVLVVAFIHDLFTGQLQLPGSDPCSQYETYEAQAFCAENL